MVKGDHIKYRSVRISTVNLTILARSSIMLPLINRDNYCIISITTLRSKCQALLSKHTDGQWPDLCGTRLDKIIAR